MVSGKAARDSAETGLAAGMPGRADEARGAGAVRREDRPSPLRPARCARAMTWDESEAIMRWVGGRPLATGHVELVVPVFRVAHPYLDAEDRQLGEANVFPTAMRLERATMWRTCPYAGSRYRHERPMNVTALRAMRAHWPQTMAIVRGVADAYRGRFPAVAERGWTVGDVARLTTCVMALPSYVLMRRRRRVANGRLHPALAGAYRVTDGVRMTAHDMLFAGAPARSDETAATGAGLRDHAERHGLLLGARGVCAGPPAMIDSFLAVLLDGADPGDGPLDAEVAEALGGVEAAIDYGLAGLRAYGAVYALFPAAAAAEAALRRTVTAWTGAQSPALAALRERLAGPGSGSDDRRLARLAAYDAMDRQCGLGLTGRAPDPSLVERLEAAPPPAAPERQALAAAVERRLGPAAEAAALAEGVGRFARLVQTALGAALEAQDRINALLGREPPARPFTGRDLAAAPFVGRHVEPSFLLDDVAGILGVRIEIGRDRVTIAAAPPARIRSPGGSA